MHHSIMKTLLIIASLALLVTTAAAELNDMYLHHHPSQAKKLAMAAKAANNQQPQQGSSDEYHVGGYDFRKSYDDNGYGSFRNFFDDYEEPRERRPYRGSYDDGNGGRSRQRRPFRSSYDDYRPRRADYTNDYEQRGPVVGGRQRNRMSAAKQDSGISYNKDGGIDWSNPTLKGSVFLDRGEDDDDFD